MTAPVLLAKALVELLDKKQAPPPAETEKPTAMKIAKVDEDERLVFGWASVASHTDGQLVVDSDAEVIEPEELERAVYDYVLDGHGMGERHKGKTKARLVESLMLTPEKAAAMGIESGEFTGWWTGFKIDDPALFEKVKSGQYLMMSIEGTAVPEELTLA